MSRTFSRLPAVRLRFGDVGRSTLYKKIAEGVFPPPINLLGGLAVWADHELDAIAEATVEGKSQDELRKLVAEIVAARKRSAQRQIAAAAALAGLTVTAAAVLSPLDGGLSLLAGMSVFGRRPQVPSRAHRMGPFGILISGALDPRAMLNSEVYQTIGDVDGRGIARMISDGSFGAAVRTESFVTGSGHGLIASDVYERTRKLLADPRFSDDARIQAALQNLEAEDGEDEDDGTFGLRPDLQGHLTEGQLLASSHVRVMADAEGIDIRALIHGAAGFPTPRQLSQNRTGWPAEAVRHALRRHRAAQER